MSCPFTNHNPRPNNKAYFDLLVDAVALLGADKSVAREEMRELMEFETRLSKIMVPPQSRRNFSEIYNKLQLGELKVSSRLIDGAYLRFSSPFLSTGTGARVRL